MTNHSLRPPHFARTTSRTATSILLGLSFAALIGCGGSETTKPKSDAAKVESDAALVSQSQLRESRPISFSLDIRPILTDKCFACHGPDAEAVEADLSLTTFAEATAALEGDVYAIVPGDVESSLAWQRITSSRDPMPPLDSHKSLDEDEIELIRRWIEAGAVYESHWAYVYPEATPVPAVSDSSWAKNDIDRYILHRLDQEGMPPVADADKATLLRRVTYDLTGLPPTLEELDAFLADDADDAYEKVVDRLLASDRYGERMAMYWLDLVRYADTVGYHGDQTHNASPYRDWVIWAFNKNMPFDTFTLHQLGGDLIEGANDNSLIASCYNRLLQTSHEGGVQYKEYLAIYNADRVRSVSGAWMGATVGCAQCHDHKYDPYNASDFYSLAAFFSDLDDVDHIRNPFQGKFNALPTPREPEMPVLSPLDRDRIAQLESALALTAQVDEQAALQAQIDAVKPRPVMFSRAGEPREVRLLPRGNWLDETGPVMQPAVPEFMGTLDVEGRANRLDLARWLVMPKEEGGVGELTSRVFMNRLWYLFFGQGLCPSLDDFGGQGRPPNHLELMDYLALAFVDSDWDMKAMTRMLVMSRTYRLSSVPTAEMAQRDPVNELFARQSRQRLPAEMIRDTALSVSGLMVHQLGGASSRPYQPAGYYSHLNFPQRRYTADDNTQQWRRGVYVHWQRQFLHPMLKAFDAPTREECTAQRSVSNTPLAALNLLNDPTFVEASRSFAHRILMEVEGDDAQRIAWAMRLATARPPNDTEVALLQSLLDGSRAYFNENPGEAERLLGVGLRPRDTDLDANEHAAWTETARAILNLHETITRG